MFPVKKFSIISTYEGIFRGSVILPKEVDIENVVDCTYSPNTEEVYLSIHCDKGIEKTHFRESYEPYGWSFERFSVLPHSRYVISKKILEEYNVI